MDTVTQECNECGFETDCIEGICLECRLEKEKTMDKEMISQLANDVNNVILAAVTPYQNRIKKLETALEYAKNFIDGYGEARLKENLGRDGMDAVLKEIDKILKCNGQNEKTNICLICGEEKPIDDLHRNCSK